MLSVFLAHSSNDKIFVRQVYEVLAGFGVRVWFDEAELRPGDSLIQRISSGIGQVDFIAVFLSEDSVRSEWVQRELAAASALGIGDARRVFIRLPGLSERSMPQLLGVLGQIDYAGDVNDLSIQLLDGIVRDYDGETAYRISITSPPFGAGTRLSWTDAAVREWRASSKTGVTSIVSPLSREHRVVGEADVRGDCIVDVATLMGSSGNKIWRQASRWLSAGQFEALVYLREGLDEDMRMIVSIYQPNAAISVLDSRRVFIVAA